MALGIEDPETDRLVRELAAVTGETITVATRRALEERLARVRRRPWARDDLADIIARGRERRRLDERPEDEILGYGADGLPA